MDWKDILISQAITTVIAIAQSGGERSKWRRQLLKIFRTIAAQFAADEEFQRVAKEAFR